MLQTKIQYVKRNDIDISRWDKCIEEAHNSLIYAYSWWLDNMAENWDALVLDNYKAVMPLTWKKKYGFYYLCQPFFTPSLGLFCKKEITAALTDFLKEIPAMFKYWDIDLNEINELENKDNISSVDAGKRINYLLDISAEYTVIADSYSRLARRSLAKAEVNRVKVIRDVAPADIIFSYKKEYQHEHAGITTRHYTDLSNCCRIAAEKGFLNSYLAKTPDGATIAFYIVLYDKRFVYSLIGGSTAAGKETGAFYLLTDTAIKEQAGNARVFRFEGSDKPGIAFFNSQFGAVPTSYLHIKSNRLPFPVNIFKR